MAKTYTTVVDKTAGDVFTETMWDVYIRDNVNNLITPPGGGAKRTTTQSLTTGTWTAIGFDSEVGLWDSDTVHNDVTNNSRLTLTTSGVYVVTGCIAFTGNSTGMRGATITQNGVGVWTQHAPAHADGTQLVNVAGICVVAANDYLELYGFQSSGGALNTVADGSFGPTRLAAVWVGKS